MNITEKVIILDFGSQYTKLIARRIRELGVYSEIFPYSKTIEKIKEFNPKAIILSGGPSSITKKDSPTISKDIIDLNIPILGICYGQQLLTSILGGTVENCEEREFGKAELEITEKADLFKNIPNKNFNVWMSHGDKVTKLAKEFKVIAKTPNAPYAAIQHKKKEIYALQFHPEVTHCEYGKEILSNFIFEVAKCNSTWTMKSYLTEKIEELKKQIGNNQVICAVSGGVDSSVVAVLLHKAIGNNVKCIFVNTGMLRKNEPDQVKELFNNLNIPLDYVDAEDLFLNKLKNITDPEQKRKIVGNLFIELFEKEAEKFNQAKFLAQGTLYSDVIESSVNQEASVTIKSHHNVGGLPDIMNLELVEPLKEIFKDEVRKLGTELNIPDHIIMRHPFPGPGLAIRILGEITKEKIRILQEVDNIYISELKQHGLYDKIWQAFAVLLPVKTVGVMGDGRSYEYVCALRAVNSFDGMTADVYNLPHDFMSIVSNKIVNNVKGVNRVTYDITSKPPGTIEWE